jgi:hypothetical protein
MNTLAASHHMTPKGATAVLLAFNKHVGEAGGIIIIDRPEGLQGHYTTNPGNMAGRMVMIDTLTPLDPPELNDPATLADAVNTALDNAD